MCFSDSIVSNLIIGEPVVKPFNNHKKIAIASLIWLLFFRINQTCCTSLLALYNTFFDDDIIKIIVVLSPYIGIA